MDSLKEWLSWFVQVNDPSFANMWKTNPSYLLANILYITMAGLSLKFALRHGINSRYTYLWIAALLHGVVTEMISYNLPDINNFWHSQTFMIFTKRRFPLYIVLFYPATIVHAYIAASRLKLPWWAEPFAVGLLDVLIDFPYDIMGIKMVWWSWHDTDPNIFDRHYWVPWTSYFFHMGFHSSFAFLINGSRYLLTKDTSKIKSHGFLLEMSCVLVTAMFSMAMAVVFQMVPIYHGLKDGFGMHTEIIIFILVGLYGSIVWYADRTPSDEARSQLRRKSSKWWKCETAVAILMHYTFYIFLVFFAKPENVISTGLHEPLGPKTELMDQYSITGAVYQKQRYFDPMSYNEGYIDFHCVSGGAPNMSAHPDRIGESWYTVCGTKFENHAEYIVIVWAFCLLGIFVYYNVLARSSTEETVKTKRKTN